MYEEEVLFQDNALWWSPDSSRIAFLSFDDNLVDTYSFPIYNPTGKGGAIVPFTSENTMRYPTAGHNNPIVSVHVLNLRLLDSDPRDASSFVADLDWDGRFERDDSILFNVAWLGDTTLLLKESNRNSDNGNVIVFDLTPGTFHGGVVRKLGKHGEENDDGWIDSVSNFQPTRSILPEYDPCEQTQNIHALPAEVYSDAPTAYLDIIPNMDGFSHIALFASAEAGSATFLTSGPWEVTGDPLCVDSKNRLV